MFQNSLTRYIQHDKSKVENNSLGLYSVKIWGGCTIASSLNTPMSVKIERRQFPRSKNNYNIS